VGECSIGLETRCAREAKSQERLGTPTVGGTPSAETSLKRGCGGTYAGPAQILRKQLARRLRFTPRTEGGVVWFDFEGEGLLTPLLVGTALPKAMVHPGRIRSL